MLTPKERFTAILYDRLGNTMSPELRGRIVQVLVDAHNIMLDKALTEQRDEIATALQAKSDATKDEARKTPSLGYLFGFADCYYQAGEIARDHGKGGAS